MSGCVYCDLFSVGQTALDFCVVLAWIRGNLEDLNQCLVESVSSHTSKDHGSYYTCPEKEKNISNVSKESPEDGGRNDPVDSSATKRDYQA